MTICLSWHFIKILGLLIIELHNISPFGRRCFQPLRNMLCVTKFMLGTIIPILMCMKNALSFSNNQMGFPSALNIYFISNMFFMATICSHQSKRISPYGKYVSRHHKPIGACQYHQRLEASIHLVATI